MNEDLTLEKLRIHERLASLESNIDTHNTHAEEWRNKFDDKIGKIFDRLDGLPCDKNNERHEENGRMHGYLWGAIAVIFAALGIVFKVIFGIKI